MAITKSGLYVLTEKHKMDGTDTIVDWVNDSIKFALFTNSLTAPNFSTDTAYTAAPYTSNEIPNGSGYTTGGVALASKTVTENPTESVMLDCNDPAWSGATFSSVRGGLAYDITLTNICLILVNFTADFAVTAGTLTVVLPATGMAALDCA